MLFFAPAQVKERRAPPPEGWGGAAAWVDFIKQVSQHDWVQIVQRPGPEQVLQTYGEMLAGSANPAQGLMLSLQT